MNNYIININLHHGNEARSGLLLSENLAFSVPQGGGLGAPHAGTRWRARDPSFWAPLGNALTQHQAWSLSFPSATPTKPLGVGKSRFVCLEGGLNPVVRAANLLGKFQAGNSGPATESELGESGL